MSRLSKGTWALAAIFLVLVGAALNRSLWVFIVAAIFVLIVLFAVHRRRPWAPGHTPDSGTVLSLVMYAALVAVILVTARAALGWLERPTLPLDQLSLPGYMQGSQLGFYDKSEMRLALYETLVTTILLSVVFARALISLAVYAGRDIALRPETAAFAVVLYFSSVYVPPYVLFNLPHWFPFIAGATAIQNGVWPYFSGFDFGYGLMPLAFLAQWLSWFGLSTLSLNAVIMLSNLLVGTGAFVLMRRLTGSRAVALLGASSLLLQATDTLAVTSTFRAPIAIVLGSLLLYSSLRNSTRRTRAGFLFGLTVLWNPAFGAFAAIGFLLAHGYRALHASRPERATHIKSVLAMLAGIALPLAVLWLYTGPGASRLSAFYSGSGGNLFLLGYANLAQGFNLMALAASFLGVLYLAMVLYRFTRSRKMTARTLFVGASLISAIPYVMYAAGRSDWAHQFAAYWALTPSLALLFYGLVRLLSLRRGQYAVRRLSIHKRMGFTTAAVAIAFLTIFPLDELKESIAKYATRDEPEKQKWYMDCAAGKGCDTEAKPTLRNRLRQAALPLLRIDPALGAACRDGIDILSYNDALFYYAGQCYSPIGLPTINLLVTRQEIDWYIDRMKSRQQILFDTGTSVYVAWKGDMLREIKAQLIASGYTESAACKGLTVLSKADPRPIIQRICG